MSPRLFRDNHTTQKGTAMTASTTVKNEPADIRLQEIDADRQKITDAQLADPLRAAPDPASWHARNAKRVQRLAELEAEFRNVQEFRGVALQHPDALARYLTAVIPVKARLKHIAQERSFARHSNSRGTGHVDLQSWFDELMKLANEAGDTEDCKAIVARELDSWMACRNGWATATLADRGMFLLSPEVPGRRESMPSWMKYGVHRIDQANTDA